MKWNVSYVSDLHSTERGRIIKTVAHASANELTTRFGRPAFLADDNDSALYVGCWSHHRDRNPPPLGQENSLWPGMGWGHPSKRRQGVYGALIQAAALKAREMGRPSLSLGVDPKNKESVAVHIALGFIPTQFTRLVSTEAQA